MSSISSSDNHSSNGETITQTYVSFRVRPSNRPPAGEGSRAGTSGTAYQVVCDKVTTKNGHGTTDSLTETENLGPAYVSQSVAYAIMCKIEDANLRDPLVDPKAYDHASGLNEVIPGTYMQLTSVY